MPVPALVEVLAPAQIGRLVGTAWESAPPARQRLNHPRLGDVVVEARDLVVVRGAREVLPGIWAGNLDGARYSQTDFAVISLCRLGEPFEHEGRTIGAAVHRPAGSARHPFRNRQRDGAHPSVLGLPISDSEIGGR